MNRKKFVSCLLALIVLCAMIPSYGISASAAIFTPYANYQIYIVVKSELMPARVGANDTILDLKTAIQASEGIPIEKQVISFHGAELEDNYTMSDYNIQTNSHVSLFVKGTDTSAVSVGFGHHLGLTSEGKVYAWGININGQCAQPSRSGSMYLSTPVLVEGPLADKTVVSIAAGGEFSLALTSDGKVYTWGDNCYGQLGNGTDTDSYTPVLVGGLLEDKIVTQIAAAYYHAIVMTSDGRVYTWGYNICGQLGNDTTTNSSVPVLVEGLLSSKTATAVTTSYNYSAALTSDGRIYTWGSNYDGQLGNGTTTDSSVPVLVEGLLASKTVKIVETGVHHIIALTTDGAIYTWGTNEDGQLGIDTSTTQSTVPMLVNIIPSKTIIKISTGDSHNIVLTDDGKVYTWGQNDYGALGNNSTVPTSVPVLVEGLLADKNVIDIVAASNDNMVVTDDGYVYAWGDNRNGQLGNGTKMDSYVPVQVLGVGGVGTFNLYSIVHYDGNGGTAAPKDEAIKTGSVTISSSVPFRVRN